MKKLLAILVLAFLFSGNANADKSINDWSGLYLGVYQSEDHLSASATSTSNHHIQYQQTEIYIIQDIL